MAWDYARALVIAPYQDDRAVDLVTREIVRLGFPVLESHKLAGTDREHIAALLRYFDPPPGAHILDAGCGVGAVALHMTAQRPDLRFTLLNISAAQLALAPPDMPKLHGDFHKIPAEARSFDCVMFCFTLGHGLLDACVAEASRVLRPGGVLFIYDLTTEDTDYVIPRLGYKPHPVDDVLRAAHRHGFIPTATIENLPHSTADFTILFGPASLAAHGLDRTRPVIFRFVLPSLANLAGHSVNQ